MVDLKSVEKQLRRIKFDSGIWNRAEARELPNILLPDEKISECVNGIYEGGFALLVATDMRVLLIDKKPLNFLTVEDLRFDMINELDYSHRLLGAQITISAGSKTLVFKSYNQPRLRKLISHVQHRMSEIKKQQSEQVNTQQQHLKDINKQLQMYLLAQHQQLEQQLQQVRTPSVDAPVRPDPKLSDYLFAQRLLEQFNSQQLASIPNVVNNDEVSLPQISEKAHETPSVGQSSEVALQDMLEEGRKEIFGKSLNSVSPPSSQATTLANGLATNQAAPETAAAQSIRGIDLKGLEVNPLRIAYSKLPMALRNRKFGRSSLSSHNAPATSTTSQPGQRPQPVGI